MGSTQVRTSSGGLSFAVEVERNGDTVDICWWDARHGPIQQQPFGNQVRLSVRYWDSPQCGWSRVDDSTLDHFHAKALERYHKDLEASRKRRKAKEARNG